MPTEETTAATAQTEQRAVPTPTPLPTSDPVFAIRQMLDAAGVQKDEQDLGARVRWLIAERERLTPLADVGTQLREKLIANALEEGVRAFGQEFDKEAEGADLRTLGVAAIERRRDSYKRLADAKIPDGRKSANGEQPIETTATVRTATDRPYWAHIA